MLSYLKKSETAVIVLHEIYGINKHIEVICLKLSKGPVDVFAPNMLISETVFDYKQEDIAYKNFFNYTGFEKAYNQIYTLLHNLRKRYKKIFTIGFSTGATVAWLCSNIPDLCDAVICFYGSRIRDYLEINPKCPVLLFLPTQEKSFNVSDLAGLINTKNNVYIKQLCGKHGFADPSSPNYNKQSSYQAYKDMILFMKKYLSN